ncbi:MAG: hypothetical protein JSW20_07955, partial [Nitrospiraceae bacterium]
MKPFLQHHDEHKIGPDELYTRLESSPLGLTSDEALKRQQTYGFNVLEEKEKQSLV